MSKTKVCSICGKKLSVKCFSKNKHKKDGLQNECKECRNSYNKEWRANNKNSSKKRKHRLRHKYDISVDEYNAMFIKQHGVCAICGKPESRKDSKGRPKWLCVDENHTDWSVRGLLCSNCNTGIGMLGDSIKTLESAIKYLKERGSYGE